MAELFTPTPEPDQDPEKPRLIATETKITRTVAVGLILAWLWWWWNGYEDGAYWIIAALVFLATGETRPHYYKFLSPIWTPLSYFVSPIVFCLVTITRVIIPERYRTPQKVLKPLSFKEINEALDEAAAEHENKKRE
ncbi:MAG: hypothetical protein CMM58_04240 [Rhodospirillaceae bacterium]|nr:hypothetical protein [Rhodospirillaceae bacterium]|tara:strand:+ start:660 stop:1070 length:411 start_codon:yes stop_codon:yes gene_type:complete